MNIKDQLYQALREQVTTYQLIARDIPSMSTPQVKAVFLDDQPSPTDLSKVCMALGIESMEELKATNLKPLERKPNTEDRKAKIPVLQKMIKEVQDKNKSTLKLAKGQSCVECGVNDGTIVSAHCEGIRQHALGKCLSQKGRHKASMFLCHVCHFENDNPKVKKSVEDSKRQLGNVIKTRIVKQDIPADLLQIAELSIEQYDHLSEGYMFELVLLLTN